MRARNIFVHFVCSQMIKCVKTKRMSGGKKVIITITTSTVITPPWSLNEMWNIYDVYEEGMPSVWYLLAFASWRCVDYDELCTPRADESQKEKLNEKKEEQHNFQCFRFLSERRKRHVVMKWTSFTLVIFNVSHFYIFSSTQLAFQSFAVGCIAARCTCPCVYLARVNVHHLWRAHT